MQFVMTISELIAHEAKNILSMIHSRCELMHLERVTNKSEGEFIEISHRLLDRLDRLGSFAALLGGEIHFDSMDCREVIEDVVADAGDSFSHVMIEFKDCTLTPPLILGNCLFLYHVLLNLVINAVQSMDESGKLVITLSAESQVMIDVQDSGFGMDEHVLANLFEKSFSTKQQGSGIGLSLVKKLVQFHRGTIEVESFLSKGTSFRLFFPFYSPSDVKTLPTEFIPDGKLETVLALFKKESETIRRMLDERNFNDLDVFVFACSRKVYQVLMGR